MHVGSQRIVDLKSTSLEEIMQQELVVRGKKLFMMVKTSFKMAHELFSAEGSETIDRSPLFCGPMNTTTKSNFAI